MSGKSSNMSYNMHSIISICIAKYQYNDDMAEKIRIALESNLNGKYAVITYKDYDFEAGYSDIWCHDQGYYVYVQNVCNVDNFNRSAICNYIKNEFQSENIRNASIFAANAKIKINRRFPGNYTVHVVKNFKDRDYCSDYTLTYHHNGYTAFITKW